MALIPLRFQSHFCTFSHQNRHFFFNLNFVFYFEIRIYDVSLQTVVAE